MMTWIVMGGCCGLFLLWPWIYIRSQRFTRREARKKAAVMVPRGLVAQVGRRHCGGSVDRRYRNWQEERWLFATGQVMATFSSQSDFLRSKWAPLKGDCRMAKPEQAGPGSLADALAAAELARAAMAAGHSSQCAAEHDEELARTAAVIQQAMTPPQL